MFPSGAQPDSREVQAFPLPITETPNLWIPLPDGTRLAARLWRPAEGSPVPAIIECIPYRKRDATSIDDERTHPYFAGHGYAALRIDLRGSGESDGVLEDEYLPQEQDDIIAAIAWIAEQPWCSGEVGMMGISWGGFNSLQVASRQPPALKAIIAVGATVDRYHDDVHYKGGCVLNENFGWAATSLSFMSRPPDPALRDDWREQWRHRLERQPFVAENWFAHQTRDAYWQHGSICEDYRRLKTPVLAVTGWADAYVNFVAELMQHATCPRLGIVGPWPHAYPHVAMPGPTIGFLQEALRWWDYWLKGRNTGIMDEPLYRVYCQQFSGADPDSLHTPGHWLGEPSWPTPKVADTTYPLGDGTLHATPPDDTTCPPLTLRAPADNGRQCGEYIPHCSGPEIAGDQRQDDAHSLVFDSQPLSDTLTLLGRPRLAMRVSVDQPQANLIVRLCDVSPTGISQRISYGVLNLCHRNSHSEPQAVPCDTPLDVEVSLNQACHQLAPGHRLRVSVTTDYWPLVWPSPRPVTLTLYPDASQLHVPERSSPAIEIPVHFAPAEHGGPLHSRQTRHGSHRRDVVHALADGHTRHEIVDDFGEVTYDHGLVNTASADERYLIDPRHPDSARMSKSWTQHFSRGDWQAHTETWAALHCDSEWFYLEARLQAYENGERFMDRRWSTRRKRHHV
ncbi:CocE/NonD family hydrolase [Halomonas sp. ML-15]|uniref:CocE/NonD family hydrolase n=1 Tax=Halomonas sp. ML-15 TaxID=2773305 RepID=UPI0017461653|nr:CocE/NonD family hydrolase [Halomonas sp. ML-15]MBD3894472.1 CocE/NonD family hydrolase [Halomonas sp. ML-15]